MTVMVPSRSLVTKASGPEGFEVQAVSVTARRKILPQRRKGAKPAGLQEPFFAPLRLCGKYSLFLMLGTAPLATAATPPHHTTASDAEDRKDPTGPNAPDTLPVALLQTHATPPVRCATPLNVRAPRNSPPETPKQNSALY